MYGEPCCLEKNYLPCGKPSSILRQPKMPLVFSKISKVASSKSFTLWNSTKVGKHSSPPGANRCQGGSAPRRSAPPCSAPDSASTLVELAGLTLLRKSAQQKRELFSTHSVPSFTVDLLCNSTVSLLPAFEDRFVNQMIHFIEKVKHVNNSPKDKALWDRSIFLYPTSEIHKYQCVS